MLYEGILWCWLYGGICWLKICCKISSGFYCKWCTYYDQLHSSDSVIFNFYQPSCFFVSFPVLIANKVFLRCKTRLAEKVTTYIKFGRGVSLCLKYLEAVPWTEEEEKKQESLSEVQI